MVHAARVSQSLSTELDKLMFVVIGARDFSPEITVHLIGTEVPCFEKFLPRKFQFIAQEGGFYKNAVDISIAYKIIGTHVRQFAGLNFSCLLLEEK